MMMPLISILDQLLSQPTWIILLSTAGLLSVLRLSALLANWLFVNFLRPQKNLREHYGSWALVTGSTDGIGRAYAFRLAREGLNLVLVGRNPEKLKAVSAAISAELRGIAVRTVAVDFSDDTEAGVVRLREAVEGLDLGVVVNNAGTTYPAMYLHEVEDEAWRNVVRVNVEGVTGVTRAVLPGMLKRGRGAIVCIGSGSAAAIPSYPLSAVYTATKAYVDTFSRSLHAEYKQKGIDVQCQIPMYVATKMVPFKRRSFFVPSPEAFAESAVRWIGYEPSCCPYWTHSIQWRLASLVPDAALNWWLLRHGIGRRIAKGGHSGDTKQS